MLDWALSLVVAPAWVYLVAATIVARRFGALSSDPPPPTRQAGISILKPLYGAEPRLYENLRSFAEQDYAEVQIVLGVRDSDDEALPVARALKHDLPARDIVIVVDPRVDGSNLKVSNLENMLPAARHDILVLADSDIRVDRRYLAAVAAPLADPRIGIVTCLYKGVSNGGLWSDLGALHINFGFLPSALLADAMGVGKGCFGATIALRREVLARIGGFARLRNEMADDYRLGEAVRDAGLAIMLSRYLVWTQVVEPSFRDLWRHELRWARTTRNLTPAGFAASIVITHPVAIAAISAVGAGFALTSCAILVISCLLRWISARAIARALGLAPPGAWLLFGRDFLSFTVYVASFFGRSVFWRDQHFHVGPSGRMSVDGEKPL